MSFFQHRTSLRLSKKGVVYHAPHPTSGEKQTFVRGPKTIGTDILISVLVWAAAQLAIFGIGFGLNMHDRHLQKKVQRERQKTNRDLYAQSSKS